MTSDEREGLHRAVQAEYRFASPTSPSEAMAFCLLAADVLARCDNNEVGSWAPVLKALSNESGAYVGYYPVIQRGLRGWKRELLINADHRLYQVTLACEGGLPLCVLENEDARLTRYFRELLLEHEAFPGMEVNVLARRLASALPKTLQNDVVTELAAKLIRAVGKLRREHPQLEERVAALKGDQGGDVPLDLDENTGRLLLEGLLLEPAAADRLRGALPELLVVLDVERLQVRLRARLPARLPVSTLAAAVGCQPESIRGRLYLRLELADGSRHALAALARSRTDTEMLALDPYKFRDVSEPSLVRGGAKFVLDDGERIVGQLVPRGAAGLPDDLPWCFLLADGRSEARLVSVGSGRVPVTKLLVCAPPGTEVTGSAEVSRLGSVGDRPLFEVRDGEASWRQDGSVARFRTGELEELSDDLSLSGSFHELPGADGFAWFGMPSVAYPDRVVITQAQPRVRDIKGRTPWQAPTSSTWGELQLRVDQDGATIFGAKVLVLPRGLKLWLEGLDPRAGRIHLEGCLGIEVGLTPAEGITATVTHNGPHKIVELSAAQGPPERVELVLRGKLGETARLCVAFPCRRAGFIARGRVLADDAELPLADLPYARAEVLVPGKVTHWEIDCELGHRAPRLAQLELGSGGQGSFHLATIKDVLEVALHTHEDLDHKPRLVLSETGNYRGAKVRVRRYETTLVPLGDRQVSIRADEVAQLDTATLSSLRADALPLFDPGQGRQPLSESSPGVWNMPELALTAGPWLVLVWQGEHLRCRPLLRTLPGPLPAAKDRLSAAMTISKPERRKRIGEVLRTIALEPEAEEWRLVGSFLRLLPQVPPSAFDVLIELARAPEAAAFAALTFGGDAPLRVLGGLEQLPLLWEALPMSAWLSAARQFEKIVPLEVRESVALWLRTPPAGREWLSVVHAVLTHEVPGMGDPTPSVRLAKSEQGRALLMQHADRLVEEVRTRAGEAWWPTNQSAALDQLSTPLLRCAPQLRQKWAALPQHVADVIKLPWLVAMAAVSRGVDLEASDVFAVRRARMFDPVWFEEAFAVALASLVGWHKEHKEGPFCD